MPQEERLDTGSHSSREPEFLLLGKLRRAHGLHGEIPLELHTKMLELLSPEIVVYVGDSHQPYTIETTRWKKPLLLLKFKGISDRTVVSQLTNRLVYIEANKLESLPEGEFYYHEIIGLEVFDDHGQLLGVLEQIHETGANDVYIVRDKNGTETLIPAINDMILSIDIDEGRMIVSRMEWYGEGSNV